MDKQTKRKPTGAAALGAGPGRLQGSKNKNTAAIKDMILAALDGVGGVDYLMDRAKDEKTATAFLGLIGKVLPMTIVGDKDNPARIVFEWKREQS